MSLKYFIIVISVWLTHGVFSAGPEQRIIDLRGHWKFEIGDDMEWASPQYNDKDWQTVFTPSTWEDEGFPGYDGYAWYRKSFTLGKEPLEHTIYLKIGRIDDVDEVYVNGNLVGFSGSFPPEYETAYHRFREYIIPPEFLNFSDDNVIAVRVFDEGLEGGILEGRLGIYQVPNAVSTSLNLAGIWMFRPGDNMDWKSTTADTANWDKIIVPMYWEPQGYRDMDGFAWYRKEFRLPSHYYGKDLVLVLGLIDDLDQTFVNGEKVGQTGRFYKVVFGEVPVEGDEYQKLRAYKLPGEVLNFGGRNTIAIRVYDGLIDGGIYKGPIGITTEENLALYIEDDTRHIRPSFWDMFNAIFRGRDRDREQDH